MNFISKKFYLNIPIIENSVNVIYIENKDILSRFIQDIIHQINGNVNSFIIEENEKSINFTKYVECIISPFLLDVNNKRIITKLYKELNEYAVDNLIDKIQSLLQMNYLLFLIFLFLPLLEKKVLLFL